MSDDCDHEYVLIDSGWICKHCKHKVVYDYLNKKWTVR